MEVLLRKRLSLLMCMLAASATSFRPVTASSTCPREFKTFLHDLNSQCPVSIPFSSSPVLVDGESFEIAMSSGEKNEYTAVLFYASWSPFSSIFLSQFSILSSLFPQIRHMMVEQSSAMPSVFSRYGIHSVPALLIVHQTTRMRYHGPKDLHSVINFYRRTTGLNPVVDMVEDASRNTGGDPNLFQLWNGASLKETFSREPYLLLSVLFVSSRAFLYLFPGIASCLSALWVAHIPRLKLGIFGESRQLLGRVLHLIDVKRICCKSSLCKTSVWASSLASVSLSEASSSRVLPSCNL